MVFGWSFSGYQTQDAQTYHWCELSKERAPQVSPFCLGPCRWEERKQPGCGLARRDADPPYLPAAPGTTSKAVSTANYGLHTPSNGNNCISSSPLLQRELSYPTCFLGMKSLLSVCYVPGTELDTGTIQLDSFCFSFYLGSWTAVL